MTTEYRGIVASGLPFVSDSSPLSRSHVTCVCAAIDGYNMKKYTWKLLYMYMLGYDIEM